MRAGLARQSPHGGRRRVAVLQNKCNSCNGVAENHSRMTWSRGGMLLSVAAAVLAAAPAWAARPTANLTIHVLNVLPAGGTLRLGMYDAARYPDDDSKPVASADVPAVGGETVITLHGLAPGVYGIQTFQDVNSNDKMDTSWLGLPLEPFGFSQDAKPFLSKPGFDAVKFTLVDGDNVQTIHLQMMTSGSPSDKARDAVRARQRK
jgi:uncharacterized protein (DUF2141 family)